MECPAAASQWLQETWDEIVSEPLTRSYRKLLEAFVAFEEGHGWTDGSKSLSAVGRPKQIQQWIRAARIATPAMTKPHKRYDIEFWTWWKVLQPAWRNAKTEWPEMAAPQRWEVGGDWGKLEVPGKNGLVSVVAGLYWWGQDGRQANSFSPAWTSAVKDVTWALEKMT
ncbi:hypothetical protein C8F01DRAFT_989740 [Mycena amicta]|nr:hypothetical protein C8F01DRAFT_989740 [Mycena amicta]